MRECFSFSVLLLVALVLAPNAHADGSVSSVSYSALPAALVVEVRPFDDSDENLELKQRLEQALAAKEIGTSDDAPYILNFEVRDHIGSLNSGDNRHILRFETHGGRGGGENTEARVNVFDSQDGGLINKGGGTRVSNRTIYRLELNIEQRTSGERIWDGWAEAELAGGDGRELLRRMVPAVIKNIGRTTKSEAFSLY